MLQTNPVNINPRRIAPPGETFSYRYMEMLINIFGPWKKGRGLELTNFSKLESGIAFQIEKSRSFALRNYTDIIFKGKGMGGGGKLSRSENV